MKWNWLAIAISAAVPTAAIAQQDAKDNSNQDQSKEIRVEKARADADRARADAEMQNAKRAVDAQAYERVLVKMREQRQIKAAWLGLSASPAPAALRRQLKLPDGTGLVVDFIQPESPAAKAGLKQYDLLTRLSGQLLINSEQLSVLVRTFKAGNKVHLEFLREGEHQSADAELAEHEVPPLAEETGGIAPFQFQPQSLEGLRDERLRSGVGGGGGGGGGKTSSRNPKNRTGDERRTLTLVDGTNQFSVIETGGHRVLNVVDAGSGRVMSKYPIDNDAQIHELPEDARRALGRLMPLLNSDGSSGIVGKPGSAPDPKIHPDPQPETDRPASSADARPTR